MDTLPSTHYHTPFVKQFNSAPPPDVDLSEQAQLALARQTTGLTDFGTEDFLPAYRILQNSLETEASLNPYGRVKFQGSTQRSLTNRLWAQACFNAYPEIRQRKNASPLIIIGHHRSGTTRLQRMLAQDPQLQHLRTWEIFNFAPRPGLPEHGVNKRREEVVEFLQMAQQIYPGAFVAHPMEADLPEEEMALINHSFCGFSPLMLYHIPDFYRWFLENDKLIAYRYMADAMKLLSWARNEPDDKRWLLKNPQHMLNLPTLMKVFPDAQLVFIHRDPIKTTGSALSLSWHFSVQHTDQPCRAWVRDIWMDFYEQMARRSIEARETIPANQQIDIYYEDMNRDWRAEMRRIYDFAGMEFTPATETAMSDWLDESAREGRHGGHRYALEDYGTSAEEVDARMKFYRDHYAIPYENSKR